MDGMLDMGDDTHSDRQWVVVCMCIALASRLAGGLGWLDVQNGGGEGGVVYGWTGLSRRYLSVVLCRFLFVGEGLRD